MAKKTLSLVTCCTILSRIIISRSLDSTPSNRDNSASVADYSCYCEISNAESHVMRRPLDHVTYGAPNAKSLVAPLTSDANPANIEVRVILLVLWIGLIKPRSSLKKTHPSQSTVNAKWYGEQQFEKSSFLYPVWCFHCNYKRNKCETPKKNWKHSSLDLNIRRPSAVIFKIGGCALDADLLEK